MPAECPLNAAEDGAQSPWGGRRRTLAQQPYTARRWAAGKPRTTTSTPRSRRSSSAAGRAATSSSATLPPRRCGRPAARCCAATPATPAQLEGDPYWLQPWGRHAQDAAAAAPIRKPDVEAAGASAMAAGDDSHVPASASIAAGRRKSASCARWPNGDRARSGLALARSSRGASSHRWRRRVPSSSTGAGSGAPATAPRPSPCRCPTSS